MSRLTGNEGLIVSGGGSQLITSTWNEDGGGKAIGRDLSACCIWLWHKTVKINLSVFLKPSMKRLSGTLKVIVPSTVGKSIHKQVIKLIVDYLC